MSKAEIEIYTGNEKKRGKHILTVIENIYYFASEPAHSRISTRHRERWTNKLYNLY